jgi:hypothetical protein
MIHQLIQRVELALSNAIQSAFNMDSEVFVTTWSLERHRVVAHLRRRMMKIVKKKIIFFLRKAMMKNSPSIHPWWAIKRGHLPAFASIPQLLK